MKRAAIVIFLVLLTFTSYAAEVCVNKLSLASDITWTITNQEGHVIYISEDFTEGNVCYMELSDNEHFRWNLYVGETISTDTVLMTLAVNGAVVLAVPNTIALGDNSSDFVTGVKTPVMKIVGGTTASITDFPWQVFFRFGDYMCGGTIIADRWILTAAHCTQDDDGKSISPSDMYILVGASNISNGTGKKYYIDSYTIHEAYNNTTLVNDIAVLYLEEAIDYPNAEVISLISSNDIADGATESGVMSTVSGWGITDVSPVTYTSTLKKVELPIVSNTVASAIWGNLQSTVLSAGYKNGNKDACSGDSGGPLTVEVGGVTKVAGIVSFGSENCNTYGGYTRVSSYLDWISDKTQVVPLGELTKPIGDVKVCYGTVQSTYQTSGGDAGTYEWELIPDDVAQLTFEQQQATLTWDSDFVGDVELRVRAQVSGAMSSWISVFPSVVLPTKLLDYTADTIVCEGDYITFDVEAEGDDLTYEWYFEGSFYRTTEEGRLVFPLADTINSGLYKCLIKGTCGEVETGDIAFEVWPNTRIIDQSDLDLDAKQGEDVQLSVSATGHLLSYQWYKNNILVEGATRPVFDLLGLNANDIGNYHVVVSGSCQRVISDSVYVYVDDESLMYNARIWPSVARDVLNVAISTEFLFDVHVYDIRGVLKMTCLDKKQYFALDISSLTPGVYCIHVESESLNEVFRFFKK